MLDLETAGRSVVEHPAAAPTAVDAIETRGRRRRARRRGARAVVGVVVVAVALGGVVAVTRHSTVENVAVHPVAPSSISDEQMRAHLGEGVAAGWVPVDYGDARVYVPSNWTVTAGGCPTDQSAPGWIDVGGPYKSVCNAGAAWKTLVEIFRFASAAGSRSARIINGYRVYPMDATNVAVPELRTTIHIEGPQSEQVLSTLAPSSSLVARSVRGLPSGATRAVSHNGITVDVPAHWDTVDSGSICDGLPPKAVTLKLLAIPCPAPVSTPLAPGPDGVLFLATQPWDAATRAATTPLAGTRGLYVQPDAGGMTLTVFVPVDATHVTPVEVGLGRDGRVAAAIIDSLRPDPTP